MPKLFSKRSLTGLKTRYGFLGLLVLLILLPILIWSLTTKQFELRKRASGTATCSATDSYVFVTPTGPCNDIQTAIDAVNGPNMTVQIAPGTYEIPESGASFSLNIVNKDRIHFTGSTSGSNNVILHFNGNSGGIRVASSSGSMDWFGVGGRTNNGMLSIHDSHNLRIGYIQLFDEGAHTMDVYDSDRISLYNADVASLAGGIELGNVTNLSISNVKVHNTDNAITLNNSTGVIQFSEIVENREHSIQVHGDSTARISGNTIAHNDTGVHIGYPTTNGSDVQIDRNIIAFNIGNGVENITPDKGSVSFSENNLYGNAQNYVGVGQASGTNGNISTDPLFGSEYCLQPSSPSLLSPPNVYMGHRGGCSMLPTPTPTCVPRPACLDAIPRCLIPETSDMCPPGCRYQQVQCIQAPCEPVLICPTPTPSQSDDLFFSVSDTDNSLLFFTNDGNKTPVSNNALVSGRSYQVERQVEIQNIVKPDPVYSTDIQIQLLINGQDRADEYLPYALVSQHLSGASTRLRGTFIAQANNEFIVTIDPRNTIRETNESNNQKRAILSVSPSPTPPTGSTSTIIDTRVRFAGVSGSEAEGATITLRFTNQLFDAVTSPIRVTHVGGGVYKAVISVNHSMIPVGIGYSVSVKGEKHISRKFCEHTGQTSPCVKPSDLVIDLPASDVIAFDFTGMPLEPGDLPPQDGVVNASDFTTLKTLMNKPCNELTANEKYTADVDYNGCINVRDVFLMRKTLESRYDEF